MNVKGILMGIVIGAMLSPLLGGTIGFILILIEGTLNGTFDVSISEGLFYVVTTTESSIYLGWLVGFLSAAMSPRLTRTHLVGLGSLGGGLIGLLTGILLLNLDFSLLLLHLLTSIANGALTAIIVGGITKRQATA